MVAHEAEFSQTKESQSEHAVSGAMDRWTISKADGGDLFIGPSLAGREVICTFEGKPLSYEISVDTFERVKACVLQLHSAFEPAQPAGLANNRKPGG